MHLGPPKKLVNPFEKMAQQSQQASAPLPRAAVPAGGSKKRSRAAPCLMPSIARVYIGREYSFCFSKFFRAGPHVIFSSMPSSCV